MNCLFSPSFVKTYLKKRFLTTKNVFLRKKWERTIIIGNREWMYKMIDERTNTFPVEFSPGVEEFMNLKIASH